MTLPSVPSAEDQYFAELEEMQEEGFSERKYWLEQALADKEKLNGIGALCFTDGAWHHYRILPEDERWNGFRGFGGRPFLVTLPDGRSFATTNLWSQGEVPDDIRTDVMGFTTPVANIAQLDWVYVYTSKGEGQRMIRVDKPFATQT